MIVKVVDLRLCSEDLLRTSSLFPPVIHQLMANIFCSFTSVKLKHKMGNKRNNPLIQASHFERAEVRQSEGPDSKTSSVVK